MAMAAGGASNIPRMSGLLQLTVSGAPGGEYGTFGRGDFIGEMGFLDSQRRASDAVAVTDTDCFILSRARFDAAG